MTSAAKAGFIGNSQMHRCGGSVRHTADLLEVRVAIRGPAKIIFTGVQR
jgi:hypothetical protein